MYSLAIPLFLKLSLQILIVHINFQGKSPSGYFYYPVENSSPHIFIRYDSAFVIEKLL